MERNRIDVWLKLVCLFKHRADATEACRGGHVRINGSSVKPAAAVRVGICRALRATHRKVSSRSCRRGTVQGSRTDEYSTIPGAPKTDMTLVPSRPAVRLGHQARAAGKGKGAVGRAGRRTYGAFTSAACPVREQDAGHEDIIDDRRTRSG